MECPYFDKVQKYCHAKRNFIKGDKFIHWMCKSHHEFGHNKTRFKNCGLYQKAEAKVWSVS